MHRIVPQQQTENGVFRVGGDAANHIAGIDILQVHLYPFTLEIGLDFVAKKKTDILEPKVPGRITGTISVQQILTSPFGHHDH